MNLRPSLTLVFVVFWALLVVTALVGSVYTYNHTPDVDNFRGFAEPGNTKHTGKFSYIFVPVAFMLLGAAYGFSHARRALKGDDSDEIVDFKHVLWATLFILVAGLILWLSCAQALHQAALVGLHDK